jgi:hypothetical protein
MYQVQYRNTNGAWKNEGPVFASEEEAIASQRKDIDGGYGEFMRLMKVDRKGKYIRVAKYSLSAE